MEQGVVSVVDEVEGSAGILYEDFVQHKILTVATINITSLITSCFVLRERAEHIIIFQ